MWCATHSSSMVYRGGYLNARIWLYIKCLSSCQGWIEHWYSWGPSQCFIHPRQVSYRFAELIWVAWAGPETGTWGRSTYMRQPAPPPPTLPPAWRKNTRCSLLCRYVAARPNDAAHCTVLCVQKAEELVKTRNAQLLIWITQRVPMSLLVEEYR